MHWPPCQDDEANKTLLWLLSEVLGQLSPVFMGGFNYPHICWKKKNQKTVQMRSIKLGEYLRDSLFL